MSDPANTDQERLEELLIDRATTGLTAEQQAELELRLASLGIENEDSYDLTAAAIDSAVASEECEPLPERIRNSAIAAARELIENESTPKLFDRDQSSKELKDAQRFSRRDLAGILAIAATLLLAALLWFDRSYGRNLLSIAKQYEQFLNESPVDLVRVSWTPSGQPMGENVEGEVAWSNQRQTGFMTFTGLPKNDPAVEQYQLWIFDKERNEKYPIDGGVFDIANSKEEMVVAINAKIKVHEATLFAITVERPGGVVVSDRKRLPVVAPVRTAE